MGLVLAQDVLDEVASAGHGFIEHIRIDFLGDARVDRAHVAAGDW